MKLTEDFKLERYGIHVRLVNEDDAVFIVTLRTDPKLGRYIHYTENDAEKQKEWIRKYKLREREGKDYYFIFYYENEPSGLCRIYDIEENYGTSGSWLCKPDLPLDIPILTLIISREIMFDELNLQYDRYDIRKHNTKSLRMNDLFGGIKTRETELDYYFELSKESFHIKKNYLLDLLSINR
nr:GNAT family N-acetyltransferase [uncultured Bacteroides sp.]